MLRQLCIRYHGDHGAVTLLSRTQVINSINYKLFIKKNQSVILAEALIARSCNESCGCERRNRVVKPHVCFFQVKTRMGPIERRMIDLILFPSGILRRSKLEPPPIADWVTGAVSTTTVSWKVADSVAGFSASVVSGCPLSALERILFRNCPRSVGWSRTERGMVMTAMPVTVSTQRITRSRNEGDGHHQP